MLSTMRNRCSLKTLYVVYRATITPASTLLNNKAAVMLSGPRLLSITTANQGKNIYYGYAQKKNEHRSGPLHTGAMVITGILLFCVPILGPRFVDWLDIDGGVDAKEIEEPKSDDATLEPADDPDHKKKRKITFREKKIIEYENRIRNYSTPDKIFRYFATLKVKIHSDQYDVYMTPEDFVRSLMPGIKQPEGLGLDQFRRFDPEVDSLNTGDDCIKLRPNSIFYHLEKHGLISFSDYIFLLTLLSTPPKQFELAFKMFDENGDGNLDQQEYMKVQAIIRSRTSVGKRHRDHANTGSVLKNDRGSALSKFFFGDKGLDKLSHQKFLEFHKDLQNEILWIEFHQFTEEGENMSERDFTNQILIYADFSEQKRLATCRRIRKEFKENNQGITFQEYLDFAIVLKSINEIDTALTFYHVAGAAIDKPTLQHVAKTVAGVKLTDHLVDVVFAIFDENNDERLSNKEFVSVMKRRLMRGLEKPRETGFSKLFSAVTSCATSHVSAKIESLLGH